MEQDHYTSRIQMWDYCIYVHCTIVHAGTKIETGFVEFTSDL